MRSSLATVLAACALLGAGCSTVGSSAVRTDGMAPRANVGAVRVYGITEPANVRVIGMVEVHAIQQEANLETLMPVFIHRVALLGGTGGVVDHVLTGYEWRTEMRMESYAFPCGYRMTCYSSHLVPYTYEVRFLTIQGRAIVPAGSAPMPMPGPGPAPPPPPGPKAPTGKPSPAKQGGETI